MPERKLTFNPQTIGISRFVKQKIIIAYPKIKFKVALVNSRLILITARHKIWCISRKGFEKWFGHRSGWAKKSKFGLTGHTDRHSRLTFSHGRALWYFPIFKDFDVSNILSYKLKLIPSYLAKSLSIRDSETIYLYVYV